MENDTIRIWAGIHILIALVSAEKALKVGVRTGFLPSVYSEDTCNCLKLIQ